MFELAPGDAARGSVQGVGTHGVGLVARCSGLGEGLAGFEETELPVDVRSVGSVAAPTRLGAAAELLRKLAGPDEGAVRVDQRYANRCFNRPEAIELGPVGVGGGDGESESDPAVGDERQVVATCHDLA